MTYIEDDTWENIVETMPIPSIDLVVTNENRDKVLLGKRTNRPAQNTWFVPGGRVQKDQFMVDGVHRIANEELGTDVEIIENLGWYQHLYDTSDVDEDVSKHYVPVAFECQLIEDEVSPDGQHAELRWFDRLPKGTHYYTVEYVRDAGLNC